MKRIQKLLGISVIGLVLAACGGPTIVSGGGTAAPVVMGAEGGFAILAKSGISTVPSSTITGNIGVSPAANTFLTGFSLVTNPANIYSTSAQVTGQIFASNYAPPTPVNLTTAVSDMETTFTALAGQAPHVTELGAGNIGGLTLTAGVYKWGTGLLIPTDLTLSGSATDVWVFQVAQNLTVDSAVKVVLAGGALASNVYWEVAGDVDLGTTSQFQGQVYCQTSIMMRTGASINGRLMAQTAVTLDHATVTQP